MNETQYQTFVQDHQDEIVKKIKELDNFLDADIALLKRQILDSITIRKHMPVVPFEEVKQLMVGYFAIRFIEDELGLEF